MCLTAQGSALFQIMHTGVSIRNSRREGLLSRILTPVAWIFRTLRLTAPTDTSTGRAVHLNAGRIAGKFVVDGVGGEMFWYSQVGGR